VRGKECGNDRRGKYFDVWEEGTYENEMEEKKGERDGERDIGIFSIR